MCFLWEMIIGTHKKFCRQWRNRAPKEIYRAWMRAYGQRGKKGRWLVRSRATVITIMGERTFGNYKL